MQATQIIIQELLSDNEMLQYYLAQFKKYKKKPPENESVILLLACTIGGFLNSVRSTTMEGGPMEA